MSGAERCPTCGAKLDWEKAETPVRASTRANSARAAGTSSGAASKNNEAMHTVVRLLAYFVGASLLVLLAMGLRNWFFSSNQSSEIDSPHAVRVQDAEAFRQQTFAAKSDPAAPETSYVMGIAMPADSNVLQITVKNDWKRLDYPTRLQYAQRLTERWKSVHAPHRSYFTLLDEAGAEIGGRGWSGKVWVQEKHPNAPKAKPARGAPDAARKPDSGTAAGDTSGNAAEDRDVSEAL